MREEVSVGGMWPGIYNLAEKSVSARGRCGLWASLVPLAILFPAGRRVTHLCMYRRDWFSPH